MAWSSAVEVDTRQRTNDNGFSRIWCSVNPTRTGYRSASAQIRIKWVVVGHPTGNSYATAYGFNFASATFNRRVCKDRRGVFILNNNLTYAPNTNGQLAGIAPTMSELAAQSGYSIVRQNKVANGTIYNGDWNGVRNGGEAWNYITSSSYTTNSASAGSFGVTVGEAATSVTCRFGLIRPSAAYSSGYGRNETLHDFFGGGSVSGTIVAYPPPTISAITGTDLSAGKIRVQWNGALGNSTWGRTLSAQIEYQVDGSNSWVSISTKTTNKDFEFQLPDSVIGQRVRLRARTVDANWTSDTATPRTFSGWLNSVWFDVTGARAWVRLATLWKKGLVWVYTPTGWKRGKALWVWNGSRWVKGDPSIA